MTFLNVISSLIELSIYALPLYYFLQSVFGIILDVVVSQVVSIYDIEILICIRQGFGIIFCRRRYYQGESISRAMFNPI